MSEPLTLSIFAKQEDQSLFLYDIFDITQFERLVLLAATGRFTFYLSPSLSRATNYGTPVQLSIKNVKDRIRKELFGRRKDILGKTITVEPDWTRFAEVLTSWNIDPEPMRTSFDGKERHTWYRCIKMIEKAYPSRLNQRVYTLTIFQNPIQLEDYGDFPSLFARLIELQNS